MKLIRFKTWLNEKKLSSGDLNKNSNRIRNFLDRYKNGGDFELENGNVVKLKPDSDEGKKNIELLQAALDNNEFIDFNKLRFDDELGQIHKITSFKKTKDFGSSGVLKTDSERQERDLISIINNLIKGNRGYITLLDLPGYKIKEAKKVDSLNSLGQEPYTDIVLVTNKGNLNISCKGSSAPSLAGGGLKGLNVIDKDMTARLINAIRDKLLSLQINGKPIENGMVIDADLIPDFYFEIKQKDIEKIVIGTPAMGGPIDFMYIGPMDVEFKNGQLNGQFIESKLYAKKTKFYIRVRKRDLEGGKIIIDFDSKDSSGFPIIYKNLRTKKKSLRIVIDNKITSSKNSENEKGPFSF